MLWSQLTAEAGIVTALDHAGERPENGDQNTKRRWSEKFADGCALALANEMRRADIKGKTVRPVDIASGTEPLTPLGAGTSKRIDVTVTDPLLGLEIGISLKGLNFRDRKSGNFDKNLTGRLYELSDEMRLVHEHLPHAFMAGVLFLPIESVQDKTEKGNSSFANTVKKLRERTGRLDPSLAGQAPRCDASFVALYVHGGEPEGIARGACRFLDVQQPPPRRGLPKIVTTIDLKSMVQEIVRRATYSSNEDWAEPE